MANRLRNASSPYLQQHANNPVEWHEWGEEAFALARKLERPLLLSIGYATCHWCHVMAHESFEDEEVAKVLNDTFVCIKLDREERPDIDTIYMQASQILTGSGGWPLNVLLTPDLKPFYAFTYLPKRTRFGRPGLIETARRIADAWRDERPRVEEAAAGLTSAVEMQSAMTMAGTPDSATVTAAYRQLAGSFDEEHGGFGGAPKFPSAHQLLFLLRYGVLEDEPHAVDMVGRTLEAIRCGGIHDHLGGGFHRYATDAAWRLPHFEKMLYDQAMLLMTFAEAWQVTHAQAFADTARGIASYLLRDMRDEGGAFHAAEDADSEGEEGRYYLWTTGEIDALLGEDAEAFRHAFGMAPEGNFDDEATGQRTGANLLLLADEPAMTPERLAAAKALLFGQRQQRPRPFRDDKVLTDWNGLAVAALAVAARILDEPAYLQDAESAAQFVLEKMRDSGGGLLHSWRHGRAAIAATLNDYAALVWGLLELYAATLDAGWLEQALELNGRMSERFAGPDGGFYMTVKENGLIARPKETFDGALPSGNAMVMHNLIRLARLTGDSRHEAGASALAAHFAGMAERAPAAMSHMLSAQLIAASAGEEIVLSGDRDSPEAAAMLRLLRGDFRPTRTVLWRDARSEALAPFMRDLPDSGDRVTASVCQDFSCRLPLTSAESLAAMLAGEADSGRKRG